MAQTRPPPCAAARLAAARPPLPLQPRGSMARTTRLWDVQWPGLLTNVLAPASHPHVQRVAARLLPAAAAWATAARRAPGAAAERRRWRRSWVRAQGWGPGMDMTGAPHSELPALSSAAQHLGHAPDLGIAYLMARITMTVWPGSTHADTPTPPTALTCPGCAARPRPACAAHPARGTPPPQACLWGC